MSTELILPHEEALIEMEKVVDSCSFQALSGMSELRKSFTLAQGINRLRELVDGEILDQFVALANTEMGFKTDRPPGTVDKSGRKLEYSREQIRDAVIAASLRGVRTTGNEFNIIANSCYVTKNHYKRVIRDYPGVSNLRDTYRTPIIRGVDAAVPCRAEWMLNGQPDMIDCEDEGSWIVVRSNKGMGVDAVLGKAESKLLKRVYHRITGSKQGDMEAYYGDEDGVPTPTRSETAKIEMQINWDQVEMDLNEAVYEQSIKQAQDTGALWANDCKSEEDKQKVRELTKAAIDKIKATRGERSNATA